MTRQNFDSVSLNEMKNRENTHLLHQLLIYPVAANDLPQS